MLVFPRALTECSSCRWFASALRTEKLHEYKESADAPGIDKYIQSLRDASIDPSSVSRAIRSLEALVEL